MKGCEGTQPYIEKFLWGEATPAEVAGFEGHAAGCASCKEAFAGAAAFDVAMKGTLPALAAGIANPRDVILEKITVGNLMNAKPPSWKTLRWRAVRGVLLLGLLATIAVAFEGYATIAIAQRKMYREIASVEVKTFGGLLERYKEAQASLPESGNAEMVADLRTYWLQRRPNSGTYPFEQDRVVDEIALDPWNEPYVYQLTGEAFILYSKGENGRDDGGGGDDIVYAPPSRG